MPGDLPLLALGGGTLAMLAMRPKVAEAAPAQRTPALFDLGRPTPVHVLTIVSGGWPRPRHERLHRALDITLPVGTAIRAVDDGVVVRVQRVDTSDAGRWIRVRHPSGMTSRYLHLSRTMVDLDDQVARGDVIGLSGNTGNSAGPHLHLDLRVPREMLALVEHAVGRPRSGWGPQMEPYGYSIPGEPWVPVDGYRQRVRREAHAEGIPLHGGTLRNSTLAYRSVGGRGEPYPEWLRALRGRSGVYVIRDCDLRQVLYVGESHSGRLYETLTRHFQDWRRWKGFWRGQYGEGHDPGLTYPCSRSEVAVRVTSARRRDRRGSSPHPPPAIARQHRRAKRRNRCRLLKECSLRRLVHVG